MKKITQQFLFSILMIAVCSGQAWAQHSCITPENSVNTAAENAFNEYVINFKKQGGDANRDLKFIPVIIHVIYRNAEDSLRISMARIQSQIDATNKQLRRLNANAKETRPMFVAAAADCDLQLCLATKKPDRTSFSGVLYHHYPNFNRGTDYNSVSAATIIAPEKYLNVWVIPAPIDWGGLAVFVWDRAPSSDGFWVGALWFGTIGPGLSPEMNGGTIFTHELAHYLGVYHTFHDGQSYNGECERANDPTIGDLCGDTPLDWDLPTATEQCNDGNRVCSSPQRQRTMTAQTENFMYYNQDSCTNMFSKDQRTRMRACLVGYRGELVSRENLEYTGVTCCDKPIDKPNLEKKIFIFPNPTKDIVYIIYRDLDITQMSIKIFNQAGHKIRELSSKKEIKQVSLDGYPDGLYYFRFTVGDASITKQVIKK